MKFIAYLVFCLLLPFASPDGGSPSNEYATIDIVVGIAEWGVILLIISAITKTSLYLHKRKKKKLEEAGIIKPHSDFIPNAKTIDKTTKRLIEDKSKDTDKLSENNSKNKTDKIT